MTVAFKFPPMVAHEGDHTRPEADLRVMQPFFINNGFADTIGIDRAHIHYLYDPHQEAVCRVDFPGARTRVTSVVPLTAVDPERAVGWWIGLDGTAVPWLFAEEPEYAAPKQQQDLAEIGAFLAANGLTKYGVRSLKRPYEVLEDEVEVEYTNAKARIQILTVVPRRVLDDTQDVWQSVWRFRKDGLQDVTDCFNYCGLPPE